MGFFKPGVRCKMRVWGNSAVLRGGPHSLGTIGRLGDASHLRIFLKRSETDPY